MTSPQFYSLFKKLYNLVLFFYIIPNNRVLPGSAGVSFGLFTLKQGCPEDGSMAQAQVSSHGKILIPALA